MSKVTAKVKLDSKRPYGEGQHACVTLNFTADYADGRNKEWSVAAPALSIAMTVKPEVAEQFEQGAAFTLTFEPEAQA